MPRLLNPQHEFFCRAYVNSPFAGNLTDAYEAAGFARDRGNAVRLSRQADVAARIVELRDADRAVERHAVRDALEEAGVDRASLVRNYATMMRANPLDYYTTGADGSVRPHLDRLDRQKGLAVREIVIDATSARASTSETKLRLRFYDKHKAMLALQKLIEFSEEIPVPDRDLPSPEQERDQVVATLRDYARFAEDDDVMAMAREAVAAARERYPEGNLTTFERIMSAVRRDREARAAHAAAAEAAAEQKAQELAAMAALLPGGAVARLKEGKSPDDDGSSAPDVATLHPGDGAENHDSKSCHDAGETVARLEQRESRDDADGSAPDVVPLHNAENHDSKSCHDEGETVARLAQRESRDDADGSAPDVVPLHPGYDAEIFTHDRCNRHCEERSDEAIQTCEASASEVRDASQKAATSALDCFVGLSPSSQ